MNRRTILLVIGGILAAGAGLLAFDFLSSAGKHENTSPPKPVLVASQAIPSRTALTPDMVHIVTRPSNDVDPNALGTMDQLQGEVSLADIPEGATITASNTSRSETVVAVHLRPGMRAISIAVDDVKDVSGLIQPGDRVDVIASPPRTPNTQPRAYRILRDVMVIAVGGLVGSQVAPPPAGQTAASQQPEARTVTLQVTPQQANLLTVADLNAVLRLALRAPREPFSSVRAEQLVFATQENAAAQPAAPAAASGGAQATKPRAPSISPVIVIDGDRVDGGSSDQGSP
jgi:pilus assembly protein CpaB